jgi:hypothetical protein
MERPKGAACIDLDLNFSPSTNLLPLMDLGLAIGQEATIRAAWLRFPRFALEPLDQVYRSTGRGPIATRALAAHSSPISRSMVRALSSTIQASGKRSDRLV